MEPRKRRNVERGGFSQPTTNESMGGDAPAKHEDQFDRQQGGGDESTGREWDTVDAGVADAAVHSGERSNRGDEVDPNLVDETEDRE